MDLVSYFSLPPRQRLDFLGIFGDDYGPKRRGHWVGGEYHAPRLRIIDDEAPPEPAPISLSLDDVSEFNPENPSLKKCGFRNAFSVRACLGRLGVIPPNL